MSKRNIFLAMGFEPEDAMVLALRSDLADSIARYIRERGIEQKDAVRLLGLPQGTVSNIVHGKIDHLSIERLMRAMARAKLPGYAMWPSVEHAKAGSMAYAPHATTVTGEVELDTDYELLPSESDYQPHDGEAP